MKMKEKYIKAIESVVDELGGSDESMRYDSTFINRVSTEAYKYYGLNAVATTEEHNALIAALDEYFN